MDISFTFNTLAITACFAVLTSLLGLYVAKKVGKYDGILSFFISLGTGILIGITLIEFLPASFSTASPILASFMIFIGFIFVVVMENFITPSLFSLQPSGHVDSVSASENASEVAPKVASKMASEHEYCVHSHTHVHDKEMTYQTACFSIGCITVCSFLDGMEISAAFHFGQQTGWLTSIGFLLHSVSNGALAASLGLTGGLGIKRSIHISWLIGGLLFLGSVFGVTGVYLLNFKMFVLPFSAGVMLYIAFTHLIPISLKDRFGWLGFLLGSLFMFALHLFIQH